MKLVRLAALVLGLAVVSATSVTAEFWELWDEGQQRTALVLLGERIPGLAERTGFRWRPWNNLGFKAHGDAAGKSQPWKVVSAHTSTPRTAPFHVELESGAIPWTPAILDVRTIETDGLSANSEVQAIYDRVADDYSSNGPVNVRSYFRKDGTYVRSHTRSRPR